MTFLSDTFAGSGNINGRTPDTTFGSLDWTGGIAPEAVNLSGGYAVATDNSALDSYGYFDIGDGVTAYGNPSNFQITFSFKTGSSIATNVSFSQVLFRFTWSTFNFYDQLRVTSDIGETDWTISASESLDGPFVFTGLAINTEYVVVMTFVNGVATYSINGETLESTFAGAGDLRYVSFITGQLSGVNYITAESIPGFLPALTIEASFSQFGANLTLPMLTLDSEVTIGSIEVDAELPMFTLVAEAHDATGENAVNLTLPALTIESRFGAQLSQELPALTAEIAMTGVALITVAANLPSLGVEAELSPAPWQVTADLRLPFIAIEAKFGIRADMTLPMMTIEAEGTTGSVVNLALTLPMLTMDGGVTREDVISVDVNLPMLQVVANITVNATLPALSMEAYIEAVVTAAYEAYAVNLNHSEKSVDEVTRYTNFPFTHIVRYQNGYYAVAADGLYLLGGSTDYASPTATSIPWEMETHLTDFDSPMLKTVDSAYIGARLGRSEAVILHAGETKEKSYKYTTPRGTGAQNHRQKFGKGVKNRYFALGLEGSGEVEIDNIEFDVTTMTRRI